MKRIVFLHGVGGSGAAMRPLAAALDLEMPCHFPDGPHAFDMGQGRQWFSVRGITEANRPQRVAQAMPDLAELLRALGPTDQTLLVGFSQGAIMALHFAAAGLPLAGVIAIAGRLAGPVAARSTWPSITLLNGARDTVMPPPIAAATAGWLHAAGAAPVAKLLPEMGHSIDQQVIAAIRASLAALQGAAS
jgi:phospholipase/carboxylesterase